MLYDPPYRVAQIVDKSYCYKKIEILTDIEKLQFEELIRQLIQQRYNELLSILSEQRDKLQLIASVLLEFETLYGAEIVGLMKGKKPDLHKRVRYSTKYLQDLNSPPWLKQITK
jgi:hypothetical protein